MSVFQRKAFTGLSLMKPRESVYGLIPRNCLQKKRSVKYEKEPIAKRGFNNQIDNPS